MHNVVLSQIELQEIVTMNNKKVLISAALLYLLSVTVANAELDVRLNLFQPGYIAPPPVYFSPYPRYYDYRHRRNDFEYWQQRRRYEHNEHRDHYNNGWHGDKDIHGHRK
jgi:hypothetical protein